MALTKLSTKGQVVLPKEVREALGLSTGTELEVEIQDGAVLLRPIRKTRVDDLLGMLPWSGPPKSPDDMDEGIARGARERS